MIPKTLYLYWGGKLSWLRFLTVYSFHKYNPDWEIKVYYPVNESKEITWRTGEQAEQYDSDDWFDRLADYAELIPFECEDMPEVHKSGIFRSKALYENGGVYCDFDILFFKPLIIPENINAIQCYNPIGNYFSDGFLGCNKGNEQFKLLYEQTLKNRGKGYQECGLNIWNSQMPKKDFKEDVWNIPMSLLYEYDSTHIFDIFSKNRPMFDVSAIGCHWYGGSIITKNWEKKISPENYNYDIMICDIIKEILKCQ